jgi:rare lipoprotein A
MRKALVVALAAVVAAGCAHKKRTTSKVPAIARIGHTETGLASWYGYPYHGRPAADGEIYDMESLVAAHRTLPFQTWVRVTNLTNQKTVEVRIIDRGPFVHGRIIDLSHEAANQIDLIRPGVAKVRLEVIRGPTNPTAGPFAVQVGVFRDQGVAERLRVEMASRYGSARLVLRTGSPPLWRVLVGTETTQDGANQLAGQIAGQLGEKNAFVVRLDAQ